MSAFTIVAIVSVLSLSLPWVLAALHRHLFTTQQPKLVINYRYFAAFNIIIAGISVASRTLAMHYLHPAFDIVSAAIIAMVIFTFLTLFRKDNLMLAPALVWGVFVVLGALFHALEIIQTNTTQSHVLLLHIAYDLIVGAVLFIFYYKLLITARKITF